MRRLLTVALLLALLPIARSQEEPAKKLEAEPGPYDGWTKEQFAEDRKAKKAAVQKRATAYLTVRSKMTRTCSKCAGSGKQRLSGLGVDRSIMCLDCLGSGQRMRDDFDAETIVRFHFGPDRPELESIRHTLAKGLRGLGLFAMLLPVKKFEIREIRIFGERATVIAVVDRGKMPGGGNSGEVDVTQWLRQDGEWWLLDPLLRLGLDEKHPLPKVPLYPDEERVRPHHEPEALALVEKAAARIAPLAGADGREATFLVKVRPEGSKRDARYRVTIDGVGGVDLEESAFPKSGWKDSQEYTRAQSRWERRAKSVVHRVLGAPLVPSPRDFHLRMEEGAVVGHGFHPLWFLERFVAEFGEDGRLVVVTWLDMKLTPKYVEKEDGLLLSSLEVSVADKLKLYEVTWKRSSEVWFPLKIVETFGEEETTWRMSGFKVKAPPKETEPTTGDK